MNQYQTVPTLTNFPGTPTQSNLDTTFKNKVIPACKSLQNVLVVGLHKGKEDKVKLLPNDALDAEDLTTCQDYKAKEKKRWQNAILWVMLLISFVLILLKQVLGVLHMMN